MADQMDCIDTGQIWVIGDIQGDYQYSSQIISKAKEIADQLMLKLMVLEFSKVLDGVFDQYTAGGADIIIDIVNKNLTLEEKKVICCQLIGEKQPKLIMGSSSSDNKALFSQISANSELGLTADIIEIFLQSADQIIFQRAAINASTIASIVCTHQTMQLCTVKRNIFTIRQDQNQIAHKKVIEYWNGDIIKNSSGVRLLSEKKSLLQQERCSIKSQIVLGIGRGAVQAIDKITKLSEVLNCDIGVTRSLVDMGLYGHEKQIGQSGYSINAKVYLAFGISGAVQHLVGLKNAGYIISVNKDPNAPITRFSDMVIVEDINKICELILKKKEERFAEWKL